jgi:hypothetical protein
VLFPLTISLCFVHKISLKYYFSFPIRYLTQDEPAATVQYRSQLLVLAVDLGDRLMPAFNTQTGIPYGTVSHLIS